MLSAGIYKGRIVSHYWTTSQGGNPGLAFRVAIRTEFGDDENVAHTIWITTKAAGMARSQFKALNFDVDHNDIYAIGETFSLVDVEVDVILEEQTYQGRVSLKVSRFGRPSQPPTKQALIKAQGLLRAAKKTTEEEPTPAEPPEVVRPTLAEEIANPPTAAAEDIPF